MSETSLLLLVFQSIGFCSTSRRRADLRSGPISDFQEHFKDAGGPGLIEALDRPVEWQSGIDQDSRIDQPLFEQPQCRPHRAAA